MNEASKSKRILVVEDDPEILKVLATFLKTLPGVEVTAVGDARAAMRALEGGPQFQLVCLDLMLPEVSGFQLCEHIRKTWTADALPVLVASSRTSPADRAFAMELGANAYVTKPFGRADLLKQVRKLLGMPL